MDAGGVKRELEGLTMTDAFRELFIERNGLRNDAFGQLVLLSKRPAPTCYQWGEYDDEGKPRMHFPAELIPLTIQVTGNTLMLDVLRYQAERSMREFIKANPGSVATTHEVLKEGLDVQNVILNATEDGKITRDELDIIVREIRQLLNAAFSCARGQDVVSLRKELSASIAEADQLAHENA